jgi:hypothetical protein
MKLTSVLWLTVLACGSEPSLAPAIVDAGSGQDGAIPGVIESSTPKPEIRALFIGNSYTYGHDVPSLVRSALAQTAVVNTEMVAPGGYTWVAHAADARRADSPLGIALGKMPANTVTVLQEQSLIGGMPMFEESRRASVEAAIALGKQATSRGAHVVLFQTWGRALGDPIIYYGSFLRMQNYLDQAYIDLAAYMRTLGISTSVAPVGAGFRTVYEDTERTGADPLVAGSAFRALYEGDDSHASVRGAYLASCILAYTIASVRGETFDPNPVPDEPTLDPAVSRSLRDACARTVADTRWSVPKLVTPSATLTRPTAASQARYGAAVAIDGSGERIATHGNSIQNAGGGHIWKFDAGRWQIEHTWEESLGGTLSGSGGRSSHGKETYARTGSNWVNTGPLLAKTHVFDDSGSYALVALRPTSIISSNEPIAQLMHHDGTGWVSTLTIRGRDSMWNPAHIALSGNASRLVVCDLQCRVFTRSGTTWDSGTLLLTVSSSDPLGKGPTTAISRNGDVVALGLPIEERVVVFRHALGQWREERLWHSGIGYEGFGESLALSEDGEVMVVGSPTAILVPAFGALGGVRGYTRGSNGYAPTWFAAPERLEADLSALTGFGSSTAASYNGDVVVVGASDRSTQEHKKLGAAYVYRLR